MRTETPWSAIVESLGMLLDTGNEAMRKVLLGWRLRLLSAVRTLGALEGVPECGDTRIKYGVVIDPKLPQYQSVVGAFTVQALCRTMKRAEDNRVQGGKAVP